MTLTRWRPLTIAAGACLTLSVALPATTASAHPAPASSSARHGTYVQTNLVSDVPGWAATTDPNLVNPWGASFFGASPLWVSDQGTNVSTLYSGDVAGSAQAVSPLVVSIPGGLPTGQTSNATLTTATPAFDITASDGTSGPAVFLFVGLTGHITGWAPTVGTNGAAPPSTHAQDAVVTPGASYTGLAMGMAPLGPRLYAANFASGQVEMYNGAWKRVRVAGAFQDHSLPRDFAPFNVMVSGSHVYVAYAKRGADGRDVARAGLGRVDVFTLGGSLVSRIHDTAPLDAPWGLAIAPAGFGAFAGDLIVGNFGNGRIHAYRPFSGSFVGTVRDGAGQPVAIPGLWSLLPGNGTEADPSSLLFTAGPDGETHGLLGTLSAAP
jgi:uncharacterized protein (TIGR03118 family)